MLQWLFEDVRDGHNRRQHIISKVCVRFSNSAVKEHKDEYAKKSASV